MSFNLGLYQHYNGGLYQVIGISRHSETLEEMVVYQHLDRNCGLWVRPKTMFEEILLVEGEKKPRFQYLGPTFFHPS